MGDDGEHGLWMQKEPVSRKALQVMRPHFFLSLTKRLQSVTNSWNPFIPMDTQDVLLDSRDACTKIWHHTFVYREECHANNALKEENAHEGVLVTGTGRSGTGFLTKVLANM